MSKKVGFIGSGNMAIAIMQGIISSGFAKAQEIIMSDKSDAALEKAKAAGTEVTTDNIKVAEQSAILILAVKPHFYSSVISEIAKVIPKETIVVTIAPGQTLEKLSSELVANTKIVRCMPNTPAMVCEGMTAACKNDNVTQTEFENVLTMLRSFGKAEAVDEGMMNAVIAVSGSAPAYVYMFIEAMADAAVMAGMPRKQAYQFAAQAVYGSAKMVLETGIHPGELKDMVCSPGGTTIEAVRVLEQKGMRGAVISAMEECVKKSKSM